MPTTRHDGGQVGAWRRPWRPRWWLGASVLLLVVLATAGPGGAVGSGLAGLLRLPPDASAAPPLEAIGATEGLRDVLALTGPRGISVAVGLPDGRQRTGQLVEPGAEHPGGAGAPSGRGPSLAVPRPVLLVVRGLFAGRGPPAARA
jgi:hypothetical protein